MSFCVVGQGLSFDPVKFCKELKDIPVICSTWKGQESYDNQHTLNGTVG